MRNLLEMACRTQTEPNSSDDGMAHDMRTGSDGTKEKWTFKPNRAWWNPLEMGLGNKTNLNIQEIAP